MKSPDYVRRLLRVVRLAPPGLAALVLMLSVVPGAEAAPRYQKSEVRVEAKKTKRTEAPTKKAVQQRKRPKLQAEQFRGRAQAKVAKLTDAAIGKLQELIKLKFILILETLKKHFD